MKSTLPLQFKVSSEAWEFELIHRLNHQTFAEEIPQHQPTPERRLVDKFHPENAYLICLTGRELAGMLAFRGRRPFSLDHKLPDLESFLPAGRTVCEVRLLAIDKRFRNQTVLPGLLSLLEKYATGRGYDAAVISGTTRQLRLYQRWGFKPFGPKVGTPSAQFQPMVVLLEDFRARVEPILDRCRPPTRSARHSNFLPGPVTVHGSVRRAFARTPLSHRSSVFKADFQRLQKMLCELTGAARVEILLASGTLANEAIGAQLSLFNQRGLVLSNGEFGERLIDHAKRWRLSFETVTTEWGLPSRWRASARS
jgi:GNAT superfamily N-acetyltransferase